MNKIWLVIQREYISRVRKKSFIVMTILGPVLMAALMIVPVFIAQMGDETKTVGIVDESGFFIDAFKDNSNIKFKPMHLEIDAAKKAYETMGYNMILYIPKPAYTYPSKIFIYSKKEPGMNVENYIKSSINDDLRTMRLKNEGVSNDVISAMKTSIEISSIKINDNGKEQERSLMLNFIIGILFGLSIYMFIFLYGSQVMRGVIEEKTSRIIEVIISSLKPFQLMMGKILGIALVGFTQLLLWIILTTSIVSVAKVAFADDLNKITTYQTQQAQATSTTIGSKTANINIDKNLGAQADILNAIMSINFTVLLTCFIIYFIFGYLLYAALFAAIGASVDNETDVQQFMLPVTIPLILSMATLQIQANNPDGPVSFWLSMIPLTSPISMMLRIPYGVPIWQICLSMSLLIVTFIFCTWFAGKIYRVGILMYGKKPTYKELWKWIKYKS